MLTELGQAAADQWRHATGAEIAVATLLFVLMAWNAWQEWRHMTPPPRKTEEPTYGSDDWPWRGA